MIFENYIRDNRAAFLARLREIAGKLGADPDNLIAVMYLESRVNPAAVNAASGATGLIQFMPATAASLGTTTAKLKAMNSVEQLDYVYKYLKPYTGRLITLADTYAAVFFPAMLGKPDTWTLRSGGLSADTIARANPIFDLDKSKTITAGEFRQAIYKLLPAAIAGYLKKKGNMIRTITVVAFAALLVYAGAQLYVTLKK